MFIELFEPEPIDVIYSGAATSSPEQHRIKLRIGERNSNGRFWINLSFRKREDAEKFIKKLRASLDDPREFNP
jgi:hypothetical protein